MKKFISFIKNVLNPVKATRLARTSVQFQKAIDEAESKFRKDGHRYYVIFDPKAGKLISITYDLYKLRYDSYIYLRRRGRFGNPVSRNDLKRGCYYYTPSKNGAKRMPEIMKRISMMRLRDKI